MGRSGFAEGILSIRGRGGSSDQRVWAQTRRLKLKRCILRQNARSLEMDQNAAFWGHTFGKKWVSNQIAERILSIGGRGGGFSD